MQEVLDGLGPILRGNVSNQQALMDNVERIFQFQPPGITIGVILAEIRREVAKNSSVKKVS
jgi:hypothetical protein